MKLRCAPGRIPHGRGGKDFVRINLQGAPVGGHRLGQQLRALGASGLAALLAERNPQVGLGPGPVLRQLFTRVNLQGAAQGADRLGQ